MCASISEQKVAKQSTKTHVCEGQNFSNTVTSCYQKIFKCESGVTMWLFISMIIKNSEEYSKLRNSMEKVYPDSNTHSHGCKANGWNWDPMTCGWCVPSNFYTEGAFRDITQVWGKPSNNFCLRMFLSGLLINIRIVHVESNQSISE